MAKKIFQKLYLSDYNTWQGIDNEKKPLPVNFNVETNEYVRDLENLFQIL